MSGTISFWQVNDCEPVAPPMDSSAGAYGDEEALGYGSAV